jgi:hypothetical protein
MPFLQALRSHMTRGIVFRHFYRGLANSAGKDFRDGAVGTIRVLMVHSSFAPRLLLGLPYFIHFSL